MGGAPAARRGSAPYKKVDFGDYAGWRHADLARAERSVPKNPARQCDVQTHRAADGRNFGGGRQPGSFARSAAQKSDDLDGRAGAGRESRVPRKGRAIRGWEIVFPE